MKTLFRGAAATAAIMALTGGAAANAATQGTQGATSTGSVAVLVTAMIPCFPLYLRPGLSMVASCDTTGRFASSDTASAAERCVGAPDRRTP